MILDASLAEFLTEHLQQLEPWRTQAACRGKPVDWWFPPRGQVNSDALRICATCTVKRECGEHAVAFHEQGWWGGRSARSMTEGVVKKRKHSEPEIYAAGRNGCWGICRCGWRSGRYRTPAAVTVAWSEHIARAEVQG